MDVFFIDLRQTVGKADGDREEAHQDNGQDFRCDAKSHVDDENRCQHNHRNRLCYHKKRVDTLTDQREAVHEDAEHDRQNQGEQDADYGFHDGHCRMMAERRGFSKERLNNLHRGREYVEWNRK